MDQPDTLDLRDYLAVLRRRRWTVIQTIVVVVAVAVGFSMLQTPVYEASTRLLLEPETTPADDALLRQIILGQRELETQKELVASEPVALKAIETLDSDLNVEQMLRNIDVNLLRDTQIVEVRATSTDPDEASEIATAFAESYFEFRREQALDRVLQASATLSERENQARDRLDAIEDELLTATGSDVTALELERDRLQSELAGISAQRAQLSASQDFIGGGGEIIRAADVPTSPSSPKPVRTGILAFVLGAMLGVGLAFLRDFLDDKIRSEEQAARAAGRPVLGSVQRWSRQPDDGQVAIAEPSSPEAEAYRMLRTNVRFLSVGRTFRSLLVTSALPDEGKSTTAANLAVALARTGTRVVLVGSDLRRPRIHEAFELPAHPGLSDVLVGDATLGDVVKDVGVPNLRVVPAGQVPPNSAELLGSAPMTQLMGELEQISDLVVYDGAPVLAVADSMEIGPKIGAALLVIDASKTGRNAVKAAADRMAGVGVQLAGVLLNKVDPDATDGYYGYSMYRPYEAYTTDSDERPKAERSDTQVTR